jgi:hypothetical protein
VPPFGIPSLGRTERSRRQRSPAILPSPLLELSRATLKSFTKPIAMSHQIHTYTELQQQIHDDLRIQHPEWGQVQWRMSHVRFLRVARHGNARRFNANRIQRYAK